MRRSAVAASLLVAQLAVDPGWATDLSTPDAAVKAFRDAYRRKDVDDIVAVRAFEFEARQALARKLGGAEPDQGAILRLAQQKEAEFRRQAGGKGVAIDYSQCTVESASTLRADLVKFPQQCAGPGQTTLFLSIHAVKLDAGWRLVLGPVAQ